MEQIEHVTGTVQDPGHRRRQRNARLIDRARKHGVMPAELKTLELPSNFGVLSAEPPRWRRLLDRWLPRRR